MGRRKNTLSSAPDSFVDTETQLWGGLDMTKVHGDLATSFAVKVVAGKKRDGPAEDEIGINDRGLFLLGRGS